MRSAILLLAMVLVGCPGTPVCLCTAPELRLSWSEGGNFNSGVDGNVPLNAVTRGCSRKTRLRIDNVGLAAARLTLSTSSPSITLLGAPETLGVAEGQDFEVLASSSVDAELVIELEGQPTLHFQLQGAMVEPPRASPVAQAMAVRRQQVQPPAQQVGRTPVRIEKIESGAAPLRWPPWAS